MSRRISNFAGILLLLMMAATLAACGVGEANPGAGETAVAETALPVVVAYPARTDLYATYLMSGAIAADEEAPVRARAAGEVVRLFVEEGDAVVPGQVLAQLDGERLRLEVAHAKALLDKVSKEYERNVKLKERNLVSAAAVEELRFDLAARKAALQLKELDYDYTYVRAPIAGVVSARAIKPGQHINIDDEAFRITDPSTLVAKLRIPQSELARIAAGQGITMQVDALPGATFDAEIARISPTVDIENGTFRATAYIDNADGALAPGMFGRFCIAYERRENALTIPRNALVREDDESVVYVVEGNAAVRRTLETGIETSDSIEVISGLSENEQVVVIGQGGLRDGSKVLAGNLQKASVSG